MKPIKLIAVPENVEDNICASIHVNDLKGKCICMLWMDGKITFPDPTKDYDADDLKHYLKLSSIFYTLFNNLLELQEKAENKTIYNPILERQ